LDEIPKGNLWVQLEQPFTGWTPFMSLNRQCTVEVLKFKSKSMSNFQNRQAESKVKVQIPTFQKSNNNYCKIIFISFHYVL